MALSSIFFYVVLFLLSFLVTGPSFMSIWSLVLELWQFSFIRSWPEIRKWEITSSEFFSIFGDCGKLRISDLAWISLMKCYWMLQYAMVTAFTNSKLLRQNQKGGRGWGKITSTQVRVNAVPFQWRPLIFIGKNLWHRVSEANKRQVYLKSYILWK